MKKLNDKQKNLILDIVDGIKTDKNCVQLLIKLAYSEADQVKRKHSSSKFNDFLGESLEVLEDKYNKLEDKSSPYGAVLKSRIRYHKEFEAQRRLQETCKHDGGTYTEVTDFHRRNFGTFCKKCKKLLSENG
jgi:hypothetical protein